MSNEVIYETQEAIQRPLETVKQEILSLTRQAQMSAVHYYCEIGKRLCEAKAQVAHGEWGEWLKNEVDYSQSTAENFMKIYKEYGSNQMSLFSDLTNSQTIGKLDVSKLLLLTSVPADEREEVAKEVDAENISVRELKEKLKERDTELETEKSRADKATEDIKKLIINIEEKEARLREYHSEITKLEYEIKSLSADNEDNELADIQKAELEKVKSEYENKITKIKESQKKDAEKMKEKEAKFQNELAKAKAEKDAAERKYDEIQKAVKKLTFQQMVT